MPHPSNGVGGHHMSKHSCHHHILMVPLPQCRSHFPSPPDPHQPPEKPKSHQTGHGESIHGARPASGTHHVSIPPRLCLQSQQQDQAHILHPVIFRAAGPNPPGLGHLLPRSLAALSHQAAHRLSTRLMGWGGTSKLQRAAVANPPAHLHMPVTRRTKC